MISTIVEKTLQETFDIPFDVSVTYKGLDPIITIVPSGHDEMFFRLILAYHNALRLKIRFERQKYSVTMMKAMGASSDTKKMSFCAYARSIRNWGSKIEFTINGKKQNPFDYKEWPSDWLDMTLSGNIIPVFHENEDKDFEQKSSLWAVRFMGLILSLLDVAEIDEDDDLTVQYSEGTKYKSQSTKYERNPINRALCLDKYGYKCHICGFDFEETYGKIGRHFIHVHHIIPVSKGGHPSSIDNLQLAHLCCNRDKSSKLMEVQPNLDNEKQIDNRALPHSVDWMNWRKK